MVILCRFKCALLCIDCWNGIQRCHLQCRSLPYNAAVVSRIESIVSLTQRVLYYPCESSTMDALKGTSIFIQLLLGYFWTGQIISGAKKEKKNISIINQCFSFLVFVVYCCWLASWLQLTAMLFRLDGCNNNKKNITGSRGQETPL